jgi:hypothetical protein
MRASGGGHNRIKILQKKYLVKVYHDECGGLYAKSIQKLHTRPRHRGDQKNVRDAAVITPGNTRVTRVINDAHAYLQYHQTLAQPGVFFLLFLVAVRYPCP